MEPPSSRQSYIITDILFTHEEQNLAENQNDNNQIY